MDLLKEAEKHVEWLHSEISRLEISNAVKHKRLIALRSAKDPGEKLVPESSSTTPISSNDTPAVGDAICVLDISLDPNGREVVGKELATKLVVDTLAERSKSEEFTLKKVKLSGKSFTKEAAEIVAKSLSELKNIAEADFADIIAGRMEEEALEVLHSICASLLPHKTTLRMLDLSDNALGEKGVRKLMPIILELTQLEEVRFKNNGLSALAMELLMESLEGARKNLKKMVFDNNMSGDGGAQAVGAFAARNGGLENLKEFCMSSSRVRVDGGVAVITAIAANAPSLRVLDLTDSMIGENGATALSLAIREGKLKSLKTLCLKDAGLEVEGVEIVAKALADPMALPELESLDLTLSELTPSILQGPLGTAFSLRRDQLTSLVLDENNELGFKGVSLLFKLLMGCKKLSYLSMKECELGHKSGALLAHLACSSLCEGQFSLDLDGNMFNTAEGGVKKIQEIVSASNGKVILAPMPENFPDEDPDNDNEDDEDDEGNDSDDL